MSKMIWATVTALSPVRIQLDGDAAPLPLTPNSLVDPLLLDVGDRVRCELANNRVLIIGAAGGPDLAISPIVLAAAAAKSKILNGGLRTNQDGYVSGASIPIGTYALDGIKASGVANRTKNPRASVNTTDWTIAATGGGTAAGSRVTAGGPLSNAASFFRATVSVAAPAGFQVFLNEADTPIAGGLTERVSLYVRSTTACTVNMLVNEYTGVGGGINQTTTGATPVALAANVWTRLDLIVPTALSSRFLRPYVYTTATTLPIAATFDVSAVLCTDGSILYPYFDGDTTDCSWSGTTGASVSYNVPNVVPTLTGTFDPNFGSLFTLNANARVSQIIERSRVPAGTHVANHGGTATMRVYNNTTAPGSRPAFAAGPFIFTADGTDDVVVEFSGAGSGATIGQMRMFAGSTDFGFYLPPIGDELRDCQRYYRRWTSPSSGAILLPGQMVTTTIAYITAPIDGMRAQPVPSQSGTLQIYRPGFVAGDPATFNSIALAGPSFIALQFTCNTANAASSALAFLYSSAAGQWIALDARIR